MAINRLQHLIKKMRYKKESRREIATAGDNQTMVQMIQQMHSIRKKKENFGKTQKNIFNKISKNKNGIKIWE